MKKTSTLIVLLTTLICGCNSTRHVIYRTSSDHTSEILYLYPFIALTSYRTHPEVRTNSFELQKSHWLNEPEQAAHTGDIESPLVLCVKEIGWVPADGVIFGRGIDPQADVFDSAPSYFILSLDRLEFFKSQSKMNDALKGFGVHHTKLLSIDIFFTELKKEASMTGYPHR